jgi:hypothetical protein
MSTRSNKRKMLADWFVRELAKVQLERPARQGVTEDRELEWVAFERDRLLELVNAERAKPGKPAVNMAAAMQIETSATGHFDYTQKLALGAADLVLGT